jgi:hypothetical protein
VTAVSIARVDFREIRDFRIRCENCGIEIIIPIQLNLPKYLECAGCNEHLWGDSKAAQVASVIRSYLCAWQNLDHKLFSIAFSVPQFEFAPKVNP